MKTRIVRPLATFLLALSLAGCAAPAPRERFYWPRLPETPRIEWLAAYTGSRDFENSNPLLTVFESEVPLDLAMPYSIASDGAGKVYVGDLKKAGVLVFDSKKKKVSMLGADAPKKPTGPAGIAVDTNGDVYIADGDSKSIFVYDAEGLGKMMFPLGTNSVSIGGLAIDAKGRRLLMADNKGHKVVIMSLDGTLIKSFGQRGLEEGEFNYPTTVTVDKESNIYVCDSQNARIQVFSPEGKFISKLGKRGDRPGDMAIPKAVALDSQGHVYVTDGKLNSFSIFNRKGDYLLTVGGRFTFAGGLVAPGGFNIPQGIFIDQNDRIYVADQMNGRIQIFQYLNEGYLKEHPLTEGVPAKEEDQAKPAAKQR